MFCSGLAKQEGPVASNIHVVVVRYLPIILISAVKPGVMSSKHSVYQYPACDLDLILCLGWSMLIGNLAQSPRLLKFSLVPLVWVEGSGYRSEDCAWRHGSGGLLGGGGNC